MNFQKKKFRLPGITEPKDWNTWKKRSNSVHDQQPSTQMGKKFHNYKDFMNSYFKKGLIPMTIINRGKFINQVR
jgi:hypothetical protein